MKIIKNPFSAYINNCLVSIFLLLALQTSAQAQLSLNGLATHSELGKEQFVAGLYVSTLSSTPSAILLAQEEKRVEVRVTAERFSSRRFKRMWIEGMAVNASSAELAKHAKNMAKFSNLIKLKMISGDVFTIERTLSLVRITINEVELGTIDDTSFFDLLLRTWIGPVPLSSEFRQGLMLAGDINDTLLSRYENIEPTNQRISVIKEGVRLLKEKNKDKESQVSLAASNVAAPEVAAPKIDAPKVAAPIIEAPKITAADSQTDTTAQGINIEAPSLDIEPQPAATEKPQVVAIAATPKPATPKTPKPVAAKQQGDSSLFEEEEEEEFTAATLLEQQLYIAKLKRWSQRKLRYPKTSASRGHEGSVRLEITIDRSGKVINMGVLEESKYKLLNKEARAAVKRASPYPEIPDLIKGESFTFTLPVAFRLVAPKK